MTRVILISSYSVALSQTVIRAISEAGVDTEVITDMEAMQRGLIRDDVRPNVSDMLARVKAREPAPVKLEYNDDRRGDPQRDVAMLRREMLARERSNRHMLKGKGRR